MNNTYSKLCACKLGFALGLIWGVSAFCLGLASMWWGFGSEWVTLIGTVYIGYKATVLGSFIGFLYGFVDSFIFGVLIALIYNCCCSSKCCMAKCEDK